MGMYLMRQIGTRGVYGNPVLPDFMVFLNWKELPWYWHGFDMFWFAALMVVLVPGLLAFVFGWLAFRSRVTGVYLSIITQAMTYALMLAFFRNDMGFGGNNGLTDFKDILGFDLQSDGDPRRAVRGIGDGAGAGLPASAGSSSARRLGPGAARDPRRREPRCASSATGSRTTSCSSSTFSAMLAGIAGALYVPQVGIINPSEFAPANSIEIVIWVAVGGRGTLYGAMHRRDPGQLRQDLLHRRAARRSGCSCSAACSCWSRCSCPRASSALLSGSGRLGAARLRAGRRAPRLGRPPATRRAADDRRPLHGTLLYLDGVTVSFDGFRALNSCRF